MYGVAPPRSSGSRGGVAGGEEELRTYQDWRGNNVFFLGGRFIFGPDVSSLFLSVFLIVAPVAVFCVFVARKLMDDFAGHWGISIMVIVVVLAIYVLVVLLVTSGRDPGIVPRNAYPPEPESYEGSGQVGLGLNTQLRLPRSKEVNINGVTVKVKYCDTCMLYRPPRCSHCSICDNCVDKFDHHCPWVGQCIGTRNYRFYFMFVSSATLLCLYVHGFCWVYIRRIMDSERTTIWKGIAKSPASIVLIVYSFIAVWFVGGLTAFHLYLISTNQSTYENFRYRYDRRVNPFNKGIIHNFMEVFCTSFPPSRNNFRAKAQKQPGRPPRVVSSGLDNPNFEKSMDSIQIGRELVRHENATASSESQGQYGNDGKLDKDSVLAVEHLELSRITPADDLDERALHPRQSSWGRSESWDMQPGVATMASHAGDTNRIISASDDY